MTDRDRARLAGVHSSLIASIDKILAAMAALGFPMLVVSGVRSEAAQAALYAQGRTMPGKIVTNCDGTTKRSNHQTKTDGYGHACDCCFLVDGKASWDEALPWRMYGEAAKALGLTWGGDWTGFRDLPHIELPGRVT